MKQLNLFWISWLGVITTLCVALSATTGHAEPPWASMDYTRFDEMQGVDSTGHWTWSIPLWGSEQGYKLQGVVLNNPHDMLDPTPGYTPDYQKWNLGGKWQVFIQSVDDDPVNPDIGGAALWMGQNYGNLPWRKNPAFSYTDEQWKEEVGEYVDGQPGPFGVGGEFGNYGRLTWLDSDGDDVADMALQAGALIEVHARGAKEYNGKSNVNEEHWNSSTFDFDIFIIDPDHGMPAPIEIQLSDVKNADDTFIFNWQDRTDGAERYQAQLVWLRNVSISSYDPLGWGIYGEVTITDGLGRTLPMRLGMNEMFGVTAPPSGMFDVVGIFDQEYGWTNGYRLWVMDPSQFNLIPEPSSLALAICGVLGVLILTVRRRRSANA